MTNANPFADAIAALKHQRAEIDELIAGLEKHGGPGAAVAGIEATELDETTFHGWTIMDAAREYLRMAKKALTAPEIAEALIRGGIKSESANFTNTLYTTLKRDDDREGDVIKLPKRKWGITEDWPQAARKRATDHEKARERKAQKAGADAATPTDPEALPTEPEQPSEQSPNVASA